MTIRVGRPLPECRQCGTPTRRSVWLANGGLCTDDLEVLAATVKMDRLPPAPDQLEVDLTAYVERYTPPVPGADQ